MFLSYLGFEQADQLAGEIKNPQRTCRQGDPHLGGDRCRRLHPGPGGDHRAMPSNLLTNGFTGIADITKGGPGPQRGRGRRLSVRCRRGHHRPAVAVDRVAHRRLRLPGRTAIIYDSSTSRIGHGLARNRYYPKWLQSTGARGVPWISLIVSFVFGIFFLLPFPAGRRWSAWSPVRASSCTPARRCR